MAGGRESASYNVQFFYLSRSSFLPDVVHGSVGIKSS